MDQLTQGFIPGPNETEEQFQERVAYCLNLRETLPQGANLEVTEQRAILDEAASITKQLYSIAPEWPPVIFSNHNLSLWHGGCAWIFQLDDDAPLGSFLQLRTTFQSEKRCFGLYDRNELVAHELCHVARMAFEEPQYEEFLAYRTSSKAWRRWLGPILRNSVESMLFVLSLLFVMSALLFSLFVDATTLRYLPYTYLVPSLLILLGAARLYLQHKRFEATLLQLKELVGDRAEALTLWLTDKEVNSFGKLEPSAIREKLKSGNSLRTKTLVKQFNL